MNALSTSEEMCLDYIRRHEKAEDGVDLNDMVRRIGEEYISMDNPESILCAVHSLHRMGVIERRYDGRYEIPEW